MSSDQIRNAILDTVQKNQPASQSMPHIPHFGINDTNHLVESFTQGVVKMAGTVIQDARPDLDDFVRNKFPNAKVICSAVPENVKALFGLRNSAIGQKRARST
jgi:L-lactate dehydrogenase complex protein LldG